MAGKIDKKSLRIGGLVMGIAALMMLGLFAVSGISAQSSANVVANGSFESGVQNWTCSYCTLTAGAPAQSGAAAAQLRTTSAGKRAHLFQKGIALRPNTQYELSFWAKSSGEDLQVDLLRHTSPNTNYGLNQTFDVTSSWQKFTVTFTTKGFNNNVTNGRLRFRTPGGSNQEFSIDDIVLVASGGSAPPTSTPSPTPPSSGTGQELLVYDWNKPITQAERGFPRINPPTENGNWVSPVNYAAGRLYFRAEIRNMPTHKDFRVQYCVWQDGTKLEACATQTTISYKGSKVVVTWDQEVSKMWKKNGVPIDWSRPRSRNGFAIKTTSGVPVSDLVAGWNWGGSNRPQDWYPMEGRLTVVVVPPGRTFSGWNNYIP